MKKILIVTGGSGGHVVPATTLYEHLRNNFTVKIVSDMRGSKFIEKNKFKIEEVIKGLDIKSSSIELIDKSILFFAINEILYGKLDKLIAIDESLRLSKKFSSPESYKFINASLDNFIKK